MRIATLLVAAALTTACAQEIKMPANLDKLAAKAEESVDVTLDKSMLRLAARFVTDGDADVEKIRRLIAGLDSIYVRSYQFAEEGDYDKADIDAFRAQLQEPVWTRVVGVKSKRDGGDVDVYLKIGDGTALGGVVVIAAEARELTIVNVVGTLAPEQLADLGGRFHVPGLEVSGSLRGWRRAK